MAKKQATQDTSWEIKDRNYYFKRTSQSFNIKNTFKTYSKASTIVV